MTILSLIIWLVIIGAALFLVNKAPFIDPEYKGFLKYVFLVIGVIVVVAFLIGVLGGDASNINMKLT